MLCYKIIQKNVTYYLNGIFKDLIEKILLPSSVFFRVLIVILIVAFLGPPSKNVYKLSMSTVLDQYAAVCYDCTGLTFVNICTRNFIKFYTSARGQFYKRFMSVFS